MGHRSFPKNVNNQRRKRGDALGEEVEEQLLAYVRSNPRFSTRHVGTLVENFLSMTWNISYRSL